MISNSSKLDCTKLSSCTSSRKFKADEIFFNAGEPGEEMYILLAGEAGVYISTVDGFSFEVTRLHPGDFFGEMSLLEGLPRSAQVKALRDSICLVIDKNNFEEIMSQFPELAMRIMKGLSQRLRMQNEELKRLKSDNMEQEAAEASPSKEEYILPQENQYTQVAKESDQQYLLDKRVQCPVCNQEFQTKTVRESKLRVERMEKDLRPIYVDFEPLWYQVWVCPHCFYANMSNDFSELSEKSRILLKEKLKEQVQAKAGPGFQPRFSERRNLNEVLVAYYLTLPALELSRAMPNKFASIWLRLSWLYEDGGEREMASLTSKKALEMMKEFYFNSKTGRLSEKQEERVVLVLAELMYKNGFGTEALPLFERLFRSPSTTKVFKEMARDRYSEIREQKNKK